jgi:hypothetical protein
MSKQIGIIKLKGNLDGISFYKSDGNALARMANGPDRARIENDPAYVRTRENNREFGGAASAGKALRTAFAESIRTMADRYFTSRLLKLFKEICVRGAGARGERAIDISANVSDLKGLEFNRLKSYSSLCTAPFTVTPNTERNEVMLDMPSFSPSTYLSVPGGATHFRIILAIGTISDFAFDSITRKYGPVDGAMNSLSAVTYGTAEVVNSAHVSYSLTASLAGAPVLPADVSLMVAVGIEFFQQVNAVDYLLSQSNGMQLVDVV